MYGERGFDPSNAHSERIADLGDHRTNGNCAEGLAIHMYFEDVFPVTSLPYGNRIVVVGDDGIKKLGGEEEEDGNQEWARGQQRWGCSRLARMQSRADDGQLNCLRESEAEELNDDWGVWSYKPPPFRIQKSLNRRKIGA
jgi:hypothetical protein